MAATLIAFGHPRPVADLFGVAGRELLDSLKLPEPWQANLVESLARIDDLGARADALELELRNLGADHPSMRLRMTVPGIGVGPGRYDRIRDRRHRPLREPVRSSRGTPACAHLSASPAARIGADPWPRTGPSTCAGR